MTEHDIKIIEGPAMGEPYGLKEALRQGYKIIHVIPFEYFYTEDKWMYPTDGSGSYSIQIKKSQQPYIKFILERDGITRLLHG